MIVHVIKDIRNKTYYTSDGTFSKNLNDAHKFCMKCVAQVFINEICQNVFQIIDVDEENLEKI